jgi:hypothetical protein
MHKKYKLVFWRHRTQHNDIQHNDTQQEEGLICNTQNK